MDEKTLHTVFFIMAAVIGSIGVVSGFVFL